MDLTNSNASFTEAQIRKQYPWAYPIEIEHERFSEALEAYQASGGIKTFTIKWGKLPSGRYVYLSSWYVYPLRQFI